MIFLQVTGATPGLWFVRHLPDVCGWKKEGGEHDLESKGLAGLLSIFMRFPCFSDFKGIASSAQLQETHQPETHPARSTCFGWRR